MKTKEDLIKAIEDLECNFESNYALEENGYKQALNDVVDLVNKLPIRIVSNSASDNVRPSDVADNEWWCPKCKMIVDGKDVTFDERHDLNGCYEKVI